MSESTQHPEDDENRGITLKSRLDDRDSEVENTKGRIGDKDKTRNTRNGEKPEKGGSLKFYILPPSNREAKRGHHHC